MLEKLKIIKEKYLLLQKEMLKAVNNIEILKEINELNKIVSIYDEYLILEKEKNEITKLISKNNIKKEENEFIVLFKEEQKNLEIKITEKLNQLKKILLFKKKIITKALLSKLKQQLEETNQICLWLIYFVLMLNMLKVKNGE